MAATGTLSLAYRQFGGFERALTQQAQAYAKFVPGFALAMAPFDVQDLYRELTRGDGCRSGRYDLVMAPTDWLPELMQLRLLQPLNELLAADPPPDWPQGWSPSMRALQTADGGGIYGLPYHDGPEVFMYRTDLFDDPDEQARFQQRTGHALQPPQTWSAFLEVARFFTRPERDLYGCVVAAKADGHNNVYDFLLHLWTRGGQLLHDGRPAFASPIGEQALQYYIDLMHAHRVTQPEPWQYDSVASGEYYASGRAAMMWNWCGFQAVADTPSLSRISGRTRATFLPRGHDVGGRSVSLNIYWVLAIPSGCRDVNAAYRFLRHLATPAMDRLTTLAGGNGTRLSIWRRPGGSPALSVLRDYRASACERGEPAATCPLPGDQRGAQRHDAARDDVRRECA